MKMTKADIKQKRAELLHVRCAAAESQNEAVRRTEGLVTFAAKVRLPFGQRSGYRFGEHTAGGSDTYDVAYGNH